LLRRTLVWLAALLLSAIVMLAACVFVISEGVTGERHPRGDIATEPLPAAQVASRAGTQREAAAALEAPAAVDTRILFGDLHVHTTYSADAFIFSLPLFQGEGVHPPADACDFARFCAELDFWSINDHAEGITPWQWTETREAIRECNAVAGDPANPDLVSYLGWEWTQSAPPFRGEGAHYGHKNVILRETADDRVPTRPVSAGAAGLFAENDVPSAVWALVRAGIALGDLTDPRPYLDFNRFARDVRALPFCDPDTPVREQPDDCIEGAPTPEDLFARLEEWGFESLVIPHGTTWGIHAPPDASLALQLEPGQHDASRQRLFESYSGHGNSELWRDLRDTVPGPDGEAVCAPPQPGYLPCCWRAGELIRARCGDIPAAVCEARVETARAYFLEAGGLARGVVEGSNPNDWLECGQLAGTFLPAYDNRPAMSAQFGLAARAFEGDEERGFRFGLIGSSDNHKARPGPGYKEVGRKAFGDSYGLRQDWLDRLARAPAEGPPSAEPIAPDAIVFDPSRLDPGSERSGAFYYTSGLVAVHAEGRDRDSIWQALETRNAYGTSGPRILLWFDMEEDGEAAGAPMGSEVLHDGTRPPRFTVRAAGAFEQKPGCPEHTRALLSPERIERLCRGECYHPSDTRHAIERIEVVRIRPQTRAGEPMADLIEDPWQSFPCPGDPAGCSVSFEDPEYTGEREFLYYVRALQVPTLAVNGDPMRCERDAEGRCVKARFCAASGPSFDPEDDCLAPVQERAWSSPIWLRPTP
jgi:hypothetical protein